MAALHNGHYFHQPDWYRQFLYEQEQQRGLDCVEDLATPGLFQWNFSKTRAILILSAAIEKPASPDQVQSVEELYDRYRTQEEERRKCFATPLARSADNYFVKREHGETLIAGYPWFTDWGRDTFVAIRGLGVATGRLTETRKILLEWAKSISEGMVPNRFPDSGEAPEYHSVDASLWYIIAVYDYLKAAHEGSPTQKDWSEFQTPVEKILKGLLPGHPVGNQGRRRRASLGRRGGRFPHLDGRAGQRQGGHAPGGQARGSGGPVAERPLGGRPFFRSNGKPSSRRP